MTQAPRSAFSNLAQTLRDKPGWALRRTLATRYGLSDLRRDAIAGLVVGIIALPLSLALGIASGVRPENGLYTAIVAGAIIALAGGSSVQVSGPTAAFVVILAPIVHEHGVGGLLIATMLAGILMIVMGLARLGRAVSFVPFPVVTGFTAGIAIVIATQQVTTLLGLRLHELPGTSPTDFLDTVRATAAHIGRVHWSDVSIGALTLGLLVFWPRVTRRLPAPLVAIAVAAAAAALLHRINPSFDPLTIRGRFGTPDTPWGIPASLPHFRWPWDWPDAAGNARELNLDLVRTLAPAAVAIALLGAIESLLSAVVADGMSGQKHDPDAELLAQGLGNVASPLFGGISATGAIARTAANIRAGARSPIASVVHAAFLVVALLALAPLLGLLPLAAMSALLIIVAWNMADAGHVVRILRSAPRADVVVLLLCLTLTVAFNMVVAIIAGVALASVLLIRRVAELSSVSLVGEGRPHDEAGHLPAGVAVYDVGGPLFFGAAERAMAALELVDRMRVVILDLRDVPGMDATGLANRESAIRTLDVRGTKVILAGLAAQPLETVRRALPHWRGTPPEMVDSFSDALDRARAVAASADQPRSGGPRHA